jgi:hypothetical protein
MSNAMTTCAPISQEAAMRHDPAAGAVVIMLRSQEKDDDKVAS